MAVWGQAPAELWASVLGSDVKCLMPRTSRRLPWPLRAELLQLLETARNSCILIWAIVIPMLKYLMKRL